MKMKRLVLGEIGTNVYFLINEETNETLIVDPADQAESICGFCEENGLIPKGILLTHSHFDHIFGVNDFLALCPVPVYACKEEEPLLSDPHMNFHPEYREKCIISVDKYLKDGEELTLAGLRFRLLHTPGHTCGSCCYYFPEYSVLICGDTLFCGSYGRTDLYTGSDEEMLSSVRRLLRELPPETVCFPGHGAATKIAFEQKYNPLA